MTIESHVTSLELSKRLKELGVKKDSFFSWSNVDTLYPRLVTSHVEIERSGDFLVSAYLASELGEMLPWFIEKENVSYYYGTGKARKNDKYYSEHEISYSNHETTIYLERDHTEADARSLMLIRLIEQGIVKV